MNELAPVLYIPHGGGPLPLLGDPGHSQLVEFLETIAQQLPRPEAILVVSAHWEAPVATVQGAAQPPLLFDYFGFPEESYHLQYPAPGSPDLAARIIDYLQQAGIVAATDQQRGFDHGLFIPLLLMYPAADIPCLQLSLLDSMNPAAHIELGAALAGLREQGVMILGSGSPFHNMQAFQDGQESLVRCREFNDWLVETCCNLDLEAGQERLRHWEQAPHGRYAHPREEHLLPLHVCLGAASAAARPARHVFDGEMMGYRMSSFVWE